MTDELANTPTDEEGSAPAGTQGRWFLFNLLPSWSISFISHVILLVILAAWFLRSPVDPPISFQVSPVSGEQLEEMSVDLSTMDMEPPPLDAAESEPLVETPPLVELPQSLLEVPELPGDLLPSMPELTDAEPTDLLTPNTGTTSGETSARAGDDRQKALQKFGGTPESEESVELALEWLARHQNTDGSWNFDHTIGSGNRSQKNPGTYRSYTAAATGLALLPFLGAGYTHREGKYQEVVRKGLLFLIEKRGKPSSAGLSFFVADYSDDMYSHGLASLAILEAYSMTRDSWLKGPAQSTLDFIEFAQHPAGGWRYSPKEIGDTSVVGWQVMALKSGKMAGLRVDPQTFIKVSKFLDFVGVDEGAQYGYIMKPNDLDGSSKATTAIGLLCRMYMGWGREYPPLGRGIDWLAKYGPSTGDRANPKDANMYYNYYATQVLKQFGGPQWTKWNDKMRDYLVDTQDREGAERGSWFFPRGDQGTTEGGDPTSSGPGGRLYCTCLAAMTLEVYYRYLPLYKDEAVEQSAIKLDD